MNCWHCDQPAHGVCQFCGRAVCKAHTQAMPHIVAVYRSNDGRPMVIVTDNAVFCGVCRPKGDPIQLDSLDEE